MLTNPLFSIPFLAIIGIASGSAIAAGIFALIPKIGVVAQIANKTKTTAYITSYETAVLLGGITGTLFTIFHFSITLPSITILIAGLSYGIFLGCLATALGEALDVTAIFTRRLKLHKGIPFIVLSMALGKTLGSLIYYIRLYFPKK